jgi:hypothetical protein
MIGVTTAGDHNKTSKALKNMNKSNLFSELHRYGVLGVSALAQATPIDSSLTANSWAYRIVQERNGPRIEWYNTNDAGGGTSVAVLIQYGHGTKNGGYVIGRDFINPAIQPLFDRFAEEIWKKVKT